MKLSANIIRSFQAFKCNKYLNIGLIIMYFVYCNIILDNYDSIQDIVASFFFFQYYPRVSSFLFIMM